MSCNDSFAREEVLERSTEYFNDDLSASAFVTKYALKQTTDEGDIYKELTPNDMHDRLAREFAKIEQRYPNPKSYEEIRNILDHFKYIVPGGSVMYGAGNPYVRISLSNCIVIDSPIDSVSGIMNTGKEMANLFKARCGVGVSIDTLRPDGTVVNNSAGTSTGAWSFADFYSNVCRMIGQNGRRGALMITMNVKHPDILKFVVMKSDLSKVTGANISVMVTNDFMNAVREDRDWTLQYPIDVPIEQAKVVNVVSARALWRSINESAVKCAEPGIIFWDNYQNNLPANEYPDFKSICVNPCSEIALSAYDSCRLLSQNLKNLIINAYTSKAYIDEKQLEYVVRLGMRLMDDIVDMEIDCIQSIIDKVDEPEGKALWRKLLTAAINGRRTGMGAHGIADFLAGLCAKYDSDKALNIINKTYESIRNYAYDESINLAIERGAFPAFDWEIEKNNEFINRLPQNIIDRMAKHGRRGISLLTMAPTGTVSMVSQTSSGIEPIFMLSYIRRKKINPSDINARVDFTDPNGDRWTEFFVIHQSAKEYMDLHPEILAKWEDIQANMPKSDWSKELTSLLPDFFVTSMDIDPVNRVRLQGTVQKYIDHGISSTINMPENTTVEQCMELYEKAWETGCKGATIYVQGSRSGVLIKVDKTETLAIQDTTAPKRPKELSCDIHYSNIDGQKWTIFVGLLEGRPYEIFGGLSEHVIIPRKFTEGKIAKRQCEKVNAKGRFASYDLILGDKDDPMIVKDIAVTFNDGTYAAWTRQLSLSLRHGIPLHYIAEQLGRDQSSEFFSFSRVMARVIKKYVKDGIESGENCPECGAKLRFESGCFICPQCACSPKCS